METMQHGNIVIASTQAFGTPDLLGRILQAVGAGTWLTAGQCATVAEAITDFVRSQTHRLQSAERIELAEAVLELFRSLSPDVLHI